MKTVTAVCTVLLLAGLAAGFQVIKKAPKKEDSQTRSRQVDSPIIITDGTITINRHLIGDPHVADLEMKVTSVVMEGLPLVDLSKAKSWTLKLYNGAGNTVATISSTDSNQNKIDFDLPNFEVGGNGTTIHQTERLRSATISGDGVASTPPLQCLSTTLVQCTIRIHYCHKGQCSKT